MVHIACTRSPLYLTSVSREWLACSLVSHMRQGINVRIRVNQNERSKRDWMGALLLVISLLLPFAQFAFGLQDSSDTTLPICCRAHGRHKCTTPGLLQAQHSSQTLFTRATEKCPCPRGLAPAGTHGDPLWNSRGRSAEYLVYGRYEPAEINGRYPVHFLGHANPKRGPPSSSQIAL